MILNILLVLFINNLFASEVLYDTKMAKLLNHFNGKNLECGLEIGRGATFFSIESPKYRNPAYIFRLPIEADIDLYEDIGGQVSDCKINGQVIRCNSEEPGRMPETNAQSFQHLELKLDKNQNIIDMHLYKIEKRYLFSHELPMFEKKYAEVFCPERD